MAMALASSLARSVLLSENDRPGRALTSMMRSTSCILENLLHPWVGAKSCNDQDRVMESELYYLDSSINAAYSE